MSRRRDFSTRLSDGGQSGSERDPQYLMALERAFDVLRSFREQDSDLSTTELVERTGFTKPMVSRITNTLTRLGYLTYAERTGTYSLAAGLVALAAPLLTGISIRDRARPLMRELADTCGSSLILSAPSGLTMTYVEHVQGSGALALQFALGSQVPMERTAMGRAYLSSLSREVLAQTLVTLADAGRLEDGMEGAIGTAIAEVHECGFCLSLGYWRPEIHAVATPLAFPGASMPLVLSCGGPSFLLKESDMREEIGPRLVDIARQLGAEPTRSAA